MLRILGYSEYYNARFGITKPLTKLTYRFKLYALSFAL